MASERIDTPSATLPLCFDTSDIAVSVGLLSVWTEVVNVDAAISPAHYHCHTT